MLIRECTANDLDALRRLHALQGFGYPFPDLDSPLFVTKLILEDDPEGDAKEAEQGSNIAGEGELSGRNSPTHRNSPRESAPPSGNSPRIVMAVLLRLTAEAYLLHDPAAGTPRERWQHLLALHEAARARAAARGLDDVQAFLPPRIARAFGRRLARLGWRQDPWPCFSRRV
jgi:hypothetical protein